MSIENFHDWASQLPYAGIKGAVAYRREGDQWVDHRLNEAIRITHNMLAHQGQPVRRQGNSLLAPGLEWAFWQDEHGRFNVARRDRFAP